MFKILSTDINSSRIHTIKSGTAKIYRVYKNPNAKDLFIKAQNTSSQEERTKLFEQMGDYDIVVEKEKQPSKNRLMQFLKGLFSSY
jgi:hypothetical protein